MAERENFWWYITLEAPVGMEEVLVSAAEASGCIGSLDVSRGDDARIQAYYRSNRDLGAWLAALNPLLEPWPDVKIIDMGRIENRPWNTMWMDAFPPLDVGTRLVVMAPWHAGADVGSRIPVYIYPGTAFGTGYHASTQLMLQLIEKLVRPGDTVADIGCGSAILSIAALKLGAAQAYARDVDPTVIDEALRNALELNGIGSDSFDVEVGDLLVGFDHTVDVVLANILFEPNCTLLPSVAAALNDGGRAAFSGMTNDEGDRFAPLLEANRLRLIERIGSDDGWCAFAAEKI